MQNSIAIQRNPFRPEQHREVFPITENCTIREWLDRQGIVEFDVPTICVVDGQPVLRTDWATTPATGIIVFVALPQGGGGDSGKILRTVLMVAVMVAAPYAGAALAGMVGVTSTVGVALFTAGVALVGSVLVNVLVPPPSPTLPTVASQQAPSPTYSLQGQGNSARLGEPIPVIYGRHIVYPDFAATPYTEYVNNEQFLFQLHVIGQGLYDIEQIRIEDTPISSFEEITSEIIQPGGQVTLFDADVVTAPEVAGQELLATADGGSWVGPFVVNPAETQITNISVDIEMPRGLYYANNDGSFSTRQVDWQIQRREIDDEGNPISGWVTMATESHSAADNNPIRQTHKYTVPVGRYEVQALRTDTKDTDSRAGHELRWSALRGHIVGTTMPENVTMLALKMRATDNLSQRSSRLVNCIVMRKLPIWSPGMGWTTPVPTRSIAWAMADALRAEYGAKLADERIDLQALYDLDVLWANRFDTFDAVFDQKLTVWEALNRIARCGRAVPFLQGGIVRVVRDEAKTLPVALFSPRNIVKDSFSIEYIMPGEDTADAVTVEYFNDKTWKPDEVTAALPGSTASQPAKVALYGCTNKAQALREGIYMAAANRYRRRLIAFRTELEGLIPTYGDLVSIAHDMPRWGEAGEIIAYEHPKLTLSEPVTFADGQNHYISLRKRDGSVSGPWLVTAGASATEVLLTAQLDFTPFTGTTEERTHFAFGVGENWAIKARVVAVQPRGEQVEISCVAEHPSVHSADQS